MRGQRIPQSISKRGTNSPSAPPAVPLCIRKTTSPVIQQNQGSQLQPRVMIYAENIRHNHRFHHNSAIAQALSHSHLHASVLLISDQAAPAQLDKNIQWITLASEHSAEKPHRLQQVNDMLMSFAPDIFIVENNCGGTSRELATLLRNARALYNTRCVLALDSDVNPPLTSPNLYDTLSQGIHSYYDQIWIYGDAQVEDAIHSTSFAPLIRKKIRYTGYITPKFNLHDKTTNKGNRRTLLVFSQHSRLTPATETIIDSVLSSAHELTILTSTQLPEKSEKKLIARSQTEKLLNVETDPTQLFSLLEKHDQVITLDDEETALGALAQNKPLLIIHDEQLQQPPATSQRLGQLQSLNLASLLRTNKLSTNSLQEWLSSPHSSQSDTPLDCDGLKHLPQLVGTLLTTDRRKSSR